MRVHCPACERLTRPLLGRCLYCGEHLAGTRLLENLPLQAVALGELGGSRYYCQSCGTFRREGGTHCQRCRTRLLEFIPHAGREIEVQASRVEVVPEPLPEPPREPKRNKKKRVEVEPPEIAAPSVRLESEGFCWFRAAFSLLDLGEISADLDVWRRRSASREHGRQRAGWRLAPSALTWLQRRLRVAPWPDFLNAAVGGAAHLVQAILFEKSEDAAWQVDWHRDEIIPVRAHRESTVFIAPSTKHGVPHIRANVETLARLVTLRIHLDPNTEKNGSLVLFPYSQRVTDLDAPHNARHRGSKTCLADPGDALAFRPLLLHRSSKPTSTDRRRVLQLLFAGPQPLPDGLEWPADAVSVAP